jgi:Uma2 family endonuclease
MIRHGILGEDEPVELVEGWLVKKMGKNPPHRISDFLVREALRALVPAGWYVDSQEPITTNESEPEPDIVVVRGHTRNYPDRHPGPADLALVVEVSETSLHGDQGPKQRAYARASIPVYWIVNLVDRRVEVYTQPSGPADAPAYGQRQDYVPGDAVPVVLDGNQVGQVAVNDLLP